MEEKEELTVGFIGNPNCGKTTLFNAYTGANLKVANWPGVTVEKKEGAMRYHKHSFKVVDLPGIYSLTSYTMEEKLSRQYILGDDVDVIIDVADASALERNLYLTLQLIELGKPVVLALNMMDIVEERGMEIDLHRLPEMLGIPVIPVSARKRTGLDILMHAVAHHKEKKNEVMEHHHDEKEAQSRHIHKHHEEFAVVYSDELEDKIDRIIERLEENGKKVANARWYAIKLLEKDSEIEEQVGVDLSDIVDRSYEDDIICQKYDFIEEIIEECLVHKEKKAAFTDKVDRVLTHRIFGIPVFLGIMAIVFFLTFAVGDLLAGGLETILEAFTTSVGGGLTKLGAHPAVRSLVVDGVIAGVGGILTFLPNIFILFLALAFLEDSGYMSRVAFVMDDFMGHLGLSGRAFIPMILGFGCSVPAVMASRALENEADRKRAILVTPFMSCSARLPIYVLFSKLFFGSQAAAGGNSAATKIPAMLVAFSLYLLGLLVAVICAFILGRVQGSKEQKYALLIELPEYKTPNARTIAIYVWEKVKDYLTKAGTTIFVASVIIWILLHFGAQGYTDAMSKSFGAGLGRILAPIFVPAGFGHWELVLALISGLAAKEVVVSSCSVLFGVSNINSAAGMSSFAAALAAYGFGPANAYAFMVFCLLYTPCVATISVMRQELKSGKLAAAAVLLQLVIAWVLSTAVFQVLRLF